MNSVLIMSKSESYKAISTMMTSFQSPLNGAKVSIISRIAEAPNAFKKKDLVQEVFKNELTLQRLIKKDGGNRPKDVLATRIEPGANSYLERGKMIVKADVSVAGFLDIVCKKTIHEIENRRRNQQAHSRIGRGYGHHAAAL
jgi:hypothetical protein